MRAIPETMKALVAYGKGDTAWRRIIPRRSADPTILLSKQRGAASARAI